MVVSVKFQPNLKNNRKTIFVYIMVIDIVLKLVIMIIVDRNSGHELCIFCVVVFLPYKEFFLLFSCNYREIQIMTMPHFF